MVRFHLGFRFLAKALNLYNRCESVLVGVQDWRSELVCDGFDLARVATAGGVAGWIDKTGRLQLTIVRHTIGHTHWNSAELRSAKVHQGTGHKPP